MESETGTMNYETFVQNLKEIAQTSDMHNDGWKLIVSSENTFLSKVVYQLVKLNSKEIQVEEEDQNISQFEDNNIQNTNSTTMKWEYNIIYSDSFQVPVFYFNVWTHTGSVLTLPEVWDCLSCDKLNTDMYSMITQMEHPCYGMPYYRLHPCKSAEIIQSFQTNSNNLVASWISTVGHYINLDFPANIYYNCTVNSNNKPF